MKEKIHTKEDLEEALKDFRAAVVRRVVAQQDVNWGQNSNPERKGTRSDGGHESVISTGLVRPRKAAADSLLSRQGSGVQRPRPLKQHESPTRAGGTVDTSPKTHSPELKGTDNSEGGLISKVVSLWRRLFWRGSST